MSGFNEFEEIAKAAAAGGQGGPTAKLKEVGDMVYGRVLNVTGRDHTPYKATSPEVLSNGQTVREMVITLQTEARNFSDLDKQPTNQDGTPTPPEQDNGVRNLYLVATPGSAASRAAFSAVSKAVSDVDSTRATPEIDSMLGLRINELRDTGKGNPAKLYEGVYAKPSPPSEFAQVATQAAAPAPQPVQQQFPPQQQNAPAPAQQQQFPPAQQAPAPVQQAPAPAAAPQGFPPAQQAPQGFPPPAAPQQGFPPAQQQAPAAAPAPTASPWNIPPTPPSAGAPPNF